MIPETFRLFNSVFFIENYIIKCIMARNDRATTVQVGKDGVAITKRPLREGEYFSQLDIYIDVCHASQYLSSESLILNEIQTLANDRRLEREPYLHTDGSLTLHFQNSGCDVHSPDLSTLRLPTLHKYHKHIVIDDRLENLNLNPAIMNPYDILQINGQKITRLPFNGNITIAQLYLNGKDIDLDFVKQITFTPSNIKSRPDHYYTNGISVTGLIDDSIHTFLYGNTDCAVALPRDLSNAEYLNIGCKQIHIPPEKMMATNLKRLELNGNNLTDDEQKAYTAVILGSIADLTTITNIDKTSGISTIEFNDQLTSLKHFNNRELRHHPLHYEDLRGLVYPQFVDIIRNTAPNSFDTNSWWNREEGVDLKLKDVLYKCWHCISPYEKCDGTITSKNIRDAHKIVQESNESCKLGFDLINQDVNAMIDKVKTNQPLNLTERYILKHTNLKKFEQYFENFDIHSITDPKDKAIIENGLKETGVSITDDELHILL